MNTIHNPIIPLVMESTIITNGAESVVEIILNVAFIVVIKVTMVLAWDVDVTSWILVEGWLFIVLKLTWQVDWVISVTREYSRSNNAVKTNLQCAYNIIASLSIHT